MLGSVYSVADTLVNAVPLLFAGLAVAFAFRGGMFNIGAEGQLYAGALATAVTASALSAWASVPLVTTALLAGALAGAAWGFLPGLLKARTGAHEVITTIMFNYVAILLTTFLVKAYFKAPGPVDQTALIPLHARLPELIAGTRLTWALVIGVALAAAVDWLLRRTSFGFDVVLIGSNPGAALYAGVPVSARIVATMAISGAIAGLAGGTLVLGVLYRFITHFSPGYGFTAIAVALVARARRCPSRRRGRGSSCWPPWPTGASRGSSPSAPTAPTRSGAPFERVAQAQGPAPPGARRRGLATR